MSTGALIPDLRNLRIRSIPSRSGRPRSMIKPSKTVLVTSSRRQMRSSALSRGRHRSAPRRTAKVNPGAAERCRTDRHGTARRRQRFDRTYPHRTPALRGASVRYPQSNGLGLLGQARRQDHGKLLGTKNVRLESRRTADADSHRTPWQLCYVGPCTRSRKDFRTRE